MTSTTGNADLVVVANRLPVQRVGGEDVSKWVRSPGGLVAALEPLMAHHGGAWVGWSGDDQPAAPFNQDGISLIPVQMSADEVAGHYDGFSNRTLWPLYHDAIRAPEFDASWWSAYLAVNQRYAEAAAHAVSDGGRVWVHDYHLQLVPAMLRELRPDARIGFFLHTPYPPQELFMRLPWRRDLLEGMLGADVVGFQVPVAARNFAVLANRLTDASGWLPNLKFGGRSVRVGAYPISIDVNRFDELARQPDIQARSKVTREQLGSPRVLVLGVDRLDYTKGIEARLHAYQEMLAAGSIASPDCVFLQIAVPSRDDVPAYNDERQRIEQLVGEINGDFGQMDAMPVHYLHQSLSPEELVALYCAADVMLVTPYRDGMNLVAKEYVACRIDDTGSLVLSEFAGAARQFTAATLVNPYDNQALKDAVLSCLRAPERDVRRRMRALRRSLSSWTVDDWSQAFLHDMAG